VEEASVCGSLGAADLVNLHAALAQRELATQAKLVDHQMTKAASVSGILKHVALFGTVLAFPNQGVRLVYA
jgi:hypothetical protein